MQEKYALLGKPITYSLSPKIFSHAFETEFMEATYTAHELEDISEILSLAEEFSGFNVTMPYKHDVIQFMDELDPSVTLSGAVNCIAVSRTMHGNRLSGFNTDIYGFITSMNRHRKLSELLHPIVFGSGGAARAVLAAFILTGVQRATVVLRNLSKIAELKREFGNRISLQFIPMGEVRELEIALSASDLFVNCTPIGMCDPHETLPFSNFLNANTFIFDMVYQSAEPFFCKLAKRCGAPYCSGLEMLVAQALKSHQIWFGHGFEFDEMFQFLSGVEI